MTANLKTNTVLVAISTVLLTVLCTFAGFVYDKLAEDNEERKTETEKLQSSIDSLSVKIDQLVWTDSTVIWRFNNHVNDWSLHNGQ